MLVTLAGVGLVTGMLYAAQAVLIPVALAVLLALLLTPPVRVLERRTARGVAVTVVVVLAFSLMACAGWLLSRQVATLANELPHYRHNVQRRVADIRGASRGSTIQKLESTAHDVLAQLQQGKDGRGRLETPVPVTVENDRDRLASLEATVRKIAETLVSAGLVVALTVFMLARRQDLRSRLFRLIGESRIPIATKAIDEATERVSHYLGAFAVINASYGVAAGVALMLIGVPYAFLWGVLAGTLRFIPYVGVWVGALCPVALSLAVFPGWLKPLLVVAVFLVLEPLVFLVLEPLVYGRTAGVSAVALLVAVAFWTWLWGPIGLVLSVPLTVCLVVLGNHIPGLGFLAILMGEEAGVPAPVGYYQRLLAGDADEAADIAEDYRRTSGETALCDDVLLPALSYCRRDRASGRIDGDDQAFMVSTTRDLAERAMGADTPSRDGRGARIVGCAVRDEVDDAAFALLRCVLDPARWDLELASAELLSSEVVGLVAEEPAVLICVGGVAPGGMAHTRYLVKRLRARFPAVKIVAACWAAPGLVDTDLGALGTAGADALATSLRETIDALSRLAPAAVRVTSHEPAA